MRHKLNSWLILVYTAALFLLIGFYVSPTAAKLTPKFTEILNRNTNYNNEKHEENDKDMQKRIYIQQQEKQSYAVYDIIGKDDRENENYVDDDLNEAKTSQVEIENNNAVSSSMQSNVVVLQVKVSNEVESLVQSNRNNVDDDEDDDENDNAGASTTATTTAATTAATTMTTTEQTITLMRQSMPPAESKPLERHYFVPIDNKKKYEALFGNNSSSKILEAKNAVKMPKAGLTTMAPPPPPLQYEQLLRLQDYNLLYNAERQTYFQLHTNLTATMTSHMMEMLQSRSSSSDSSNTQSNNGSFSSRLFYKIVGNTLNAAFGINAGHLPGKNSEELKVDLVKLYDATSLRQSHFNPFNPTRILIHGWLGNANANIYNELVPAYLQHLSTGRYNIFTVDWGRGAIADYITASYRVKPVGKAVAKFIDFLHKEAGMRFEDLQLIGFSMGAHIAGIAGKHVQTGRIHVIRALDPALPFFRFASETERLARSDANYVEVLHTSVGSYGFDRPLGHVDFYANWGSQQPGCFWNECSHWRAFQLFAESLMMQQPEKQGFAAQGCAPEDWQQLTRQRSCLRATDRKLKMGGDAAEAFNNLNVTSGVYYFQTNANAPFAIG